MSKLLSPYYKRLETNKAILKELEQINNSLLILNTIFGFDMDLKDRIIIRSAQKKIQSLYNKYSHSNEKNPIT